LSSTASSTVEPRQARRRAQWLGVLCLCIGVATFSLQDIVIKMTAGTYPVHQVMVIRSLAAAPLLLLLVHLESGVRSLITPRARMLALRGATLIVSYGAYYLAFPAMPLAAAVSLWFVAPLAITAIAGIILGERVGFGRWVAVAVGFLGVLVILRPGVGVMDPAAILPVAAALTYAVAQVLARRLGVTERASVMGFYQNGAFFLGAVILSLVFGTGAFAGSSHPSMAFLTRAWTVPDWIDLLLLAACGPIAALGVVLLSNAYRLAEASRVAPFEYTGLIWGVLWGYVVWDEIPAWTTLAGVALLLGAGLYVLRSRDGAEA
jgi:drug/metabolite transporter (DMT)-like permease